MLHTLFQSSGDNWDRAINPNALMEFWDRHRQLHPEHPVYQREACLELPRTIPLGFRGDDVADVAEGKALTGKHPVI
eukprot:8728343-Alexandrium_andersonii.AAC.1